LRKLQLSPPEFSETKFYKSTLHWAKGEWPATKQITGEFSEGVKRRVRHHLPRAHAIIVLVLVVVLVLEKGFDSLGWIALWDGTGNIYFGLARIS
jgi:hypothetical protein